MEKYPTNKVKSTLLWIAEQKMVSFSQLQRLLGRELTDTGYKPTALSIRTTNFHIERLRERGLAERKRIDDTTYVYTTAKGYNVVECALVRIFPTLKDLDHDMRLNEFRLFVEERRGTSGLWVPPRSSECVHGEYENDGNYIVEGQRIAIEEEMSPKAKERLRKILRDRVHYFSTTWYDATPQVQRLLERMFEEMPEIREYFVVIDREES